MSGCGRKHRAKQLTRDYLDDDSWGGPTADEEVAVAHQSPSGRHLRVTIVKVSCGEDGVTPVVSTKQVVVDLPGKFTKVIWIGVADVVVVTGNSVCRKPSPSQLENFMAANPAWRAAIVTLQKSLRPKMKISGEPSESTALANEAASEEVHSSDDLELLENPNRQSIKHRRAVFDEIDEEEPEGDEEEEENEE